MQEIIEKIAAQVGIDTDTAQKATSMIVDFITKSAPPEYLAQIKQYVPGFDEMAAQGAAHAEAAAAMDEASSGGGLMGALGGLMGGGGIAGALGNLMGGSEGGFGGALALLGNLQKDGLDLGQIQGLAGGLITQLKAVAGDEVVDKLVADIPGVGKFLA